MKRILCIIFFLAAAALLSSAPAAALAPEGTQRFESPDGFNANTGSLSALPKLTADLPTVSVAETDPQALELGAKKGQLTVSRTGATTKALIVQYTVGGTAINGVDYSRLSGRVSIPAGRSSATLWVTPKNDKLFEGDETVVVTLLANAAYAIGLPDSATVTITSDDPPPPVVNVEATTAIASESGAVGAFRFSSDAAGIKPLMVRYSVGGTATNGRDYRRLTGRVTIGANQTSAVVPVTAIKDKILEGDETVVVTLLSSPSYQIGSSPSDAVTIYEDSAPIVTAFTIPTTATSLTVLITTFTATDDVGVTGYMATESATAPLAGSGGWSATAPTSYTFTTGGAKTLYAWAKDATGNVSTSLSASVTITDTTAPTVTSFTIPDTANSLIVPITAFTATDDFGVTGYQVTETADAPQAGSGGWSLPAPTSHTFTTAGSKTLYAWAKDAAGNVSTSLSASVTITDTTAPTVTTFTIPATANSLTVPISSFTATDEFGVTGFMVTESSTAPSGTAGGWLGTAPTTYAFTTAGVKTLYAWAKDAANNVSASLSASVTITDTTAPTVTTFTIPATANSLTVSISSFIATDEFGVTGFMITESSTAPSGTAGGWSGTAPATYAFTTAGAKTLYAWAKDAANNVSASLSASVTISDTTAPTVTTFTIPATANSLTVPISSFTATDEFGVTGFMVTESSTAPSGTAGGWLGTAPTSHTFTTSGSKTLYAWAKDAAGKVSTSLSASVTITDTTAPTVTTFTIPATANSLTVPISSFIATDEFGVTGFMVTESSTAPSGTAGGWLGTAPTTYAFTTAGAKTLYAWAKDAANNVSASRNASVTITDTTAPTVTTFTIPATANSLTVSISSFTATDEFGVTGFMVTESSTAPSGTAGGWLGTAPSAYTCATAGAKTLYAWAKDAANNVSASRTASVTITLVTGGEPAGWYAGDMHVHRSCGGAPEAVASLYNKMGPQNLAAISLLADMGNGEVQNPVDDLPLVGEDDPVFSTPDRIVHWDAEWHWDATYTQYLHQALGGHIVALGLTEAQQKWEEYTYPIFQWAHNNSGIAGFAHMQYLDNTIPQTLNCCIPMEYPVEVALGTADFISEDVDTTGPDHAIAAYYRLLNCGFRPGLAAGTDYPCNSGEDLGSLLTYVKVAGGQMTYRNWIEGIAGGKTVISRNGHNEFLNLVVNNTATPGNDVNLTGAGNVPVTVQWTANQDLTGTIELLRNGVVVASKQASVGLSTPATLTETVDFTKSGWLAARRMGSDGHQVHTGAVFVTVDGAPVRASAADAQFYVQWMDNLLTKTSPGGAWNSYFPTKLDEAQARYLAAKAMYQQIALEAEEAPMGQTIFTNQTPTVYGSEAPYELGTKFWADVNGQVTQVRIYTNALEGGDHTVRIWKANGTLLAGPYTWNITSGTQGWKTFTLPTPLAIAANTDYIVVVSTSADLYFASAINGFDAPIVNGHLHTYAGSGVYSDVLGAMPTLSLNNNYFRDVVFIPQM